MVETNFNDLRWSEQNYLIGLVEGSNPELLIASPQGSKLSTEVDGCVSFIIWESEDFKYDITFSED